MSELTNLTISQARDLLAKGELSSRQLTESHVEAMAQATQLNAFVSPLPDVALEMAEASDSRRACGS